jgi:hypothetical protein
MNLSPGMDPIIIDSNITPPHFQPEHKPLRLICSCQPDICVPAARLSRRIGPILRRLASTHLGSRSWMIALESSPDLLSHTKQSTIHFLVFNQHHWRARNGKKGGVTCSGRHRKSSTRGPLRFEANMHGRTARGLQVQVSTTHRSCSPAYATTYAKSHIKQARDEAVMAPNSSAR